MPWSRCALSAACPAAARGAEAVASGSAARDQQGCDIDTVTGERLIEVLAAWPHTVRPSTNPCPQRNPMPCPSRCRKAATGKHAWELLAGVPDTFGMPHAVVIIAHIGTAAFFAPSDISVHDVPLLIAGVGGIGAAVVVMVITGAASAAWCASTPGSVRPRRTRPCRASPAGWHARRSSGRPDTPAAVRRPTARAGTHLP